ncbi:5'-nucleotidase, lipoprotein e(P4) family [Lysobacter bugurensis]|uniref:5'-nucleotidase, lipoprotein e(P4) family n=2 Tax=Cognatilysobacter bugurensis TaxID=543356 RepID=A0A918W8Z6_9GAMM|nr:5'-nucleotidase, lipoprotein e(P4) family [Lysobacter bugurensis]GHA79564.1 5'-nucleotidase, lipoprotein e(P4) family [Lysobacter bugurensis]
MLSAAVCGLVLIAGCKPAARSGDVAVDAPTPAAAATPATGVAPSMADDNLNAVAWMQNSVEYKALSAQTYHAAAQLLDRALAEPNWDALVPGERADAATGKPPAVILDVDETVLDNSPYQARLIADGSEYDETSWDRWVSEKKAKPLPGVVDFTKAAAAKGITVLYLSNRSEHLQDATLENLRAAGLPVKDESVFLGLGTFVEGCEQVGSEKACRRQLAGQQYRVLMQFGDQLGDFAQILANTPEGRTALYEEHRDWFGERWWMLPNPTYGSWEPAMFNNDFAQPREARRAAKRASLDVAR